MEFLGVGYQELLLILVLLLVVVGPERLPTVAYQIGRAVRQMQRYARAVRDEFSDEIAYLDEQYKVVKGEIQTASDSVRSTTAAMEAQMREAVPASGGGETSPLLPPLPAAESTTPAEPAPSVNGAAPHTEEAAPTESTTAAPPPLVF